MRALSHSLAVALEVGLGVALGIAVAAQSTDPVRDNDPWQRARTNGEHSRHAVAFCLRYAHGWLGHADPQSGLLPRTLNGDAIWNARDCAADNFPFLAMTAHLTGQPHLLAAAAHIFAQERRLTATPSGLPDDFVFAIQAQPPRTPSRDELVFGAAEYCKDGLLPLLEWTGGAGYRTRLVDLLRAILADAAVPSLRDHGCEVIGGLAEAYVLAAHRDPERRERWRTPLYALLDCIVAHGVRDDGLLHNAIDPRDGKPVGQGASDGWGYVLDAFLAVAKVDDEVRWHEVARQCLARVSTAAATSSTSRRWSRSSRGGCGADLG